MRTGGWEEKGRKGRNRSGEGHEGYLLRTELSLSSPPSPPGRGERTAPWSGRHTHEGREGGWEGGGKEPWGGGGVSGSCPRPGPRPKVESSSWLGLLGGEVAAATSGPLPGDSPTSEQRTENRGWSDKGAKCPVAGRTRNCSNRFWTRILDSTCAHVCSHSTSSQAHLAHAAEPAQCAACISLGSLRFPPRDGYLEHKYPRPACHAAAVWFQGIPPASGRDPLTAARAQVTWGCRTN